MFDSWCGARHMKNVQNRVHTLGAGAGDAWLPPPAVFAGWGVAGKRKVCTAFEVAGTGLRYGLAPVAAIEFFSYCKERLVCLKTPDEGCYYRLTNMGLLFLLRKEAIK